MLTPILGDPPKTCQFSGGFLAAKSHLAAEFSELSILADPLARVRTIGSSLALVGPGCPFGMKSASIRE
jgi:hypothetical protein